MAVFAAGARVAHREIVSEQIDVLQYLRAVADEVAFAKRLGDFTVFDEIRLDHAKHKVAACCVHAAAAKFGNVHAVLGCAHNVVWVFGSVGDKCVGHSNHWQVGVTLTPTISALTTILFSCTQKVPHVVGEDSVFDQYVALRRVTFIVDANCAPLAAHGSVVNQCDER